MGRAAPWDGCDREDNNRVGGLPSACRVLYETPYQAAVRLAHWSVFYEVDLSVRCTLAKVDQNELSLKEWLDLVYVFLLDELSGGFNPRFETRRHLDDQLVEPFIVEEDEERPGSQTEDEARKAKEAALLAQGRD